LKAEIDEEAGLFGSDDIGRTVEDDGDSAALVLVLQRVGDGELRYCGICLLGEVRGTGMIS
jgi:hypothetical protein